MMETYSGVPPGFRFHPTDEELVDYYLRKKVGFPTMELDVIKDVDLYKIEPWDLQEICWRGGERQSEWHFFSHKDKKYPTGTRTNRATASGFWKATGRDKAIYSKQNLIGMRKTLVFYKGRAPNGQKSDWIMHEYRLETEENGPPQEEGWVVCRVFKKKLTTNNNVNNINGRITIMDGHQESWFDDRSSFVKTEIKATNGYFHLPLIESPRTLHQSLPSLLSDDYNVNPYGMINLGANHSSPLMQCSTSLSGPQDQELNANGLMNPTNVDDQQMMDWRALDKFVASQLMSQEEEDMEKERNSNTAGFII